MKVFIVSTGEWDEYYEHGTFSTRDKAEVYVTMVNDAEEEISLDSDLRSFPTISEKEVDEVVEHFPVFTATNTLNSNEDPILRVDYFTEMPESRFFATLDFNGSLESIYAAEGFGRTVQEAQENLVAALNDAAKQAKPVDAFVR